MSEKRSIFEDVSHSGRPDATMTAGAISRPRGARHGIRAWLVVLAALLVLMIAVGGMTRLTDSGLSITEWRPVTGAIPPMSEAAWEAELEKYRQIPQYQQLNRGMSMSEFKTIYWWEWGHRQLGRVIGLVWAVGFAGFLLARQIPAGWVPRMLWVGALGGLQAVIGWWMVSSGLEGERLFVAPYRLATHLGLAFVILGYIAWYVFELSRSQADLLQARRARDRKLFGMGTGLMHLSFLQILLGALVAGVHAGRIYTDWPLMNGQFLPPFAFDLEPLWRNFFENHSLVQFMHRMVGYVLFIFGLAVWWAARKSANAATRRAFGLMALVLVGQVVLGIVTLINAAPVNLSILHQIGAIALFGAILWARFSAQYPPAQSVRGAKA